MFYFLKKTFYFGWIGFKRQGTLTFVTIFILAITSFLITCLYIFYQVSQYLILELQKKVDVSVYFNINATEKNILEIKDEILKIPGVKNVEYISTEEAMKRILKKHPDLSESIEETKGILEVASLNIKMENSKQYENIAKFLESGPFKNLIKKIDYSQRETIIKKIFSFSSEVNRLLFLFSLIFVIIAILIVYNQIRLAIYDLRKEISIQRLVGVSNWFIRMPFIVQGAICGFFSILISISISALSCWLLTPKIKILFPNLNFFDFFINNFWSLVLLHLIIGFGLGIISSVIAMKKYLKV